MILARLSIRRAAPGDETLVLQLIKELATYEKLAHEVDATEALIAGALFAAAPRAFCEIATRNDEPVGFALWFYSFSTFRGRHGIYLEDLFVRPAHRGSGAGLALLRELARRCRDENLPRLEWSVLDWNTPALGFYRRIGAEPREGWTTQRLDGEALARLAARDP